VSRERRVAALDYLDSLGVDIGTAVKLVVSTHRDDEHLRYGGDRLPLQQRVVCVLCWAGVTGRDLPDRAIGEGGTHYGFGSTAREMSRELRALLDRHRRPIWAMSRTMLFRRREDSVAVVALAPSSRAVEQSARQFRAAAEEGGGARTSGPQANRSSVVVWVEVAEVAMPLGGISSGRTTGRWDGMPSLRMLPR
jgi:hypothetical protein